MKNSLFEKIVSYALGGIGGVIFGLIISTFNVPYFNYANLPDLLLVCGFLGIIVSANIVEYERERQFEKNQKIRDETVALITHEMRTGLTSTGWAIEATLENNGANIKAEDRKRLEDVLKSISTTVMHSVNLLDISLLDVGKLLISLQWVKLSTVKETFDEIIEKYAVGAKRIGVNLETSVKLDPELRVEADLLRLRITLENLLENALQYTTGPVKNVKVNIHNDPSTMYITVSDSGMGIPESEQQKIFSAFYRASNARKILSTGSGIGLHMCYEYVQAHHGTIRFESKEGAGTTFFITLPLKTFADVNEFLNKI